jgi:2-methylcitrate dehydratase PrpD
VHAPSTPARSRPARSRAGSVSAALAERIAAFRARDVAPRVRAHAKLALLDTLGAMLAAASPRYPAGRIVMDLVRDLGGAATSTLVGQGRRSSAVHAALANGTLAYSCDIEPHHAGAILHAPAVIVPTVLAVGEAGGVSGRQLLAALVLGIEVAGRVSDALDPVALYGRGFHPTAVCGTFGAAAAAGWLLGLDPGRQAIALGLALQQASGLLAWAADPTEHSRPLNPGLAARNGITAAQLARLGFGGPPAPFDGPYDAFTAFSGTARPEALATPWATRWYTAELAYKRYASCAFTHPALDGLLGLAREEGLTARRTDRIRLRFPARGAHMIDAHPLRSHCAQYVLPVALVYGQVAIDDILLDRTRHPDVARLGARTTVVPDRALDPEYPRRYTSIVEIRATDGRTFRRRVTAARGTPENPMSPAEIRAKFQALAGGAAGARRAAALAEAVDRLERAPDLRVLAGLLRRPLPAPACRRRTAG